MDDWLVPFGIVYALGVTFMFACAYPQLVEHHKIRWWALGVVVAVAWPIVSIALMAETLDERRAQRRHECEETA